MKGEWAMWWPCAQEPRFSNSATQQLISRAFEAMSGFESYAFTLCFEDLLPAESSNGRFALPFDTARFPLALSNGEVLVLSASAEKGLRLHFPPDMSYARRREWWTKWAEQSEVVADILKRRGAQPDALTPRTWKEKWRLHRSGLPPEAPLSWWKQMIEVTRATEAVEPLLKVGALQYENAP